MQGLWWVARLATTISKWGKNKKWYGYFEVYFMCYQGRYN